jgi:dethiobiotin synthetase
MLPGLFVVGTDTGVGKTRVASAIARCLAREGRRVGVLKPLATGVPGAAGGGEDAAWLIAAAGGSIPPERVVPLAFEAPLAPVVAARLLGKRLEQAEVESALDTALAWWADRADVMVVEGIGGLLTPVAEGTTVADLAVRLDYPLVVVARRALGTLNHTLLTTEAALRRGLRVAGLVLNSPSGAADASAELAEETAADELARRLESVAVLGEVPFLGGSDPAEAEAILGGIEWSARALRPRYVPATVLAGAGVGGEEIENR